MVGQRTAALNALRGHLSEIGVVAAQGVQSAYTLKEMAAESFDENSEIVVPDCVRLALAPLVRQIDALDEAVEAIDRELEASARTDEAARRLMTIPGVGPVTATALPATIENFATFSDGMLERKTVMYKFKLTAVALANKLARIVYSLATEGGHYDDRPVAP